MRTRPNRSPSLPTLASVAPDAAQQAAMQSPETTARLFADSIKAERFEAVEPLLNDEVRTRLALASEGRTVAAYYRERLNGLGQMRDYNLFNQHTVNDSDDLVAFDLDFQYAQQTNPGKILLRHSANGWQIVGIEDRTTPSLTEVTPTDEQRAAMSDPAQVAKLFAEELKQQQYDRLDPLFSYFARQTFGQPGSIAEHYRESARRYGKLLDYSLGPAQPQPDDFSEVQVTFIHELGQLPTRIVLKKTPQGWKISRVVAQDT